MVIFMGSYSGGDYDSSGDDDSQDEVSTDKHTQPGLDDYTGDDGGDDSGEDSGSDAGTGPAAGPGGSTGGGGGGGSVVTKPPEGDDPGDSSEAEQSEESDEEQPKSPAIDEPESEPEDEVDDPDTNEGVDEDADGQENEDEEEEDDVLVVVQEVDALSAMSWGVQPVMKHVEECYGEEIELFYKPAPVREIDLEQEKQRWIDVGQQLDMPVDHSFWDNDPPESTELVNMAFEAAIEQGRGMDYIRAMWRRGIAAGRDINDREILVDLASDLGLDPEQFGEDLDEAEPETGERDELPFTFMEIQGNPVPKNGRVRYSDFKTQFTFQGIDEQEPQELQGFVDEHGPVATPEVMEVYDVQHEEAVQRLEDLDCVSSFEVGGKQFWTI